jgi:hypothetical protein
MHTATSPLGPRRSTARLVLLLVAGAAAIAVAAACGSHNVPCSSGDIQSCTCAGGAGGTQSCDSDGTYTACSCPAEGGMDSSSSTEGGRHDAGMSGDATAGDAGLPYMAACAAEAGTDAPPGVGEPNPCDPNGCEPNCDAAEGGTASPDFCFDFPNRGTFCTHRCTSDTQCPEPSTGCNGKFVCKAPDSGGGGGGA